MKISVALDVFENSHRKFSSTDRARILEVVDGFGLLDEDFTVLNPYIFDSNWRSYFGFTAAQIKVFSETPYFSEEQDLQGTIRIHPTMIIAKKSFASSQDRGPKPYPFHRHHYELSGWLDKSRNNYEKFVSALEVVCPKLFIRVPIGSECQCGERHYKE